MALYKNVDGKRVRMTPEEEAEIKAEWAANKAKPAPDDFQMMLDSSSLARALVKELAAMSNRTEDEVKDSLRSKVTLR